MSDDARIPVLVRRDAAVPLAAGDCGLALPAAPKRAAEGSGAGCACCRPQGEVGRALALLHLRLVRGELAGCRRVVISCSDADAVRLAIEADVLARARFRFAGEMANCHTA